MLKHIQHLRDYTDYYLFLIGVILGLYRCNQREANVTIPSNLYCLLHPKKKVLINTFVLKNSTLKLKIFSPKIWENLVLSRRSSFGGILTFGRMNEGKNFTIVGAGLVGSLLAIYLSKCGYNITVYERRSDMRKNRMSAGAFHQPCAE